MAVRGDDPIIGDVFGSRVVIGPVERVGLRNAVVPVRCACGVESRPQLSGLRRGAGEKCRRCAQVAVGRVRIDYPAGHRFGRRVVVREDTAVVRRTVGGNHPGSKILCRRFVCRCDCGSVSTVWLSNMLAGSGGQCRPCARRQQAAAARERDDRTLYSTWKSMLRRCYEPLDSSYKNYGARGIGVCADWSGPGGFERFRDYMGPRPSNHSVGRKNNDGPYAPGNVRWETPTQQMRNTRRTRFLSIGGERLSMSEAAARAGLSRQAVHARLSLGWSDLDAATTPKGGSPSDVERRRRGRPRLSVAAARSAPFAKLADVDIAWALLRANVLIKLQPELAPSRTAA